MASTGEVACFGEGQSEAFMQAMLSTTFQLPTKNHSIMLSIATEEKRFELLKKSYIDSRYKKDYTITAEELKYLGEQNQVLGRLAKELPPENIARLRGLKSDA